MKIVFFDGYCSLCNHLVNALMRIDKAGVLKFASLQGDTAERLLGRREPATGAETIVYLRDAAKFERSAAVLHILSDLGGFWRTARIFWLLPEAIRDLCYKLIARNRYRLMKKRETCRMPTQQERERLLP